MLEERCSLSSIFKNGGPKDFSILGGALSALGLPMLILMGLSFVMPGLFGGTLGIILCGVFWDCAPNGSGFLDSANAPAPETSNAMKGGIRRT